MPISNGSQITTDLNMWQVCDLVSELAAGLLEKPGWPELLPFMFQCIQSGT